jgi:uncharacterized membrane protein (UPF0136 family)
MFIASKLLSRPNSVGVKCAFQSMTLHSGAATFRSYGARTFLPIRSINIPLLWSSEVTRYSADT